MCRIRTIGEVNIALKECKSKRVDLFMRMPGGNIGLRVKKAYMSYGRPLIETAAEPVKLESEKDLKDCRFFAN